MKRLMEKARFVSIVGAFFASALAVAAQPEAVPGEYVVKLREPLSNYKNQMNVLSHQLGSYIKSTLPDQNIVVIKRPVFEMKMSAIKSMAMNPQVEKIEPNYIYRINKTPNDPMLGQLWGILNIGQMDADHQVGVSGTDINAAKAWDVETGSDKVVIAVIDTGVDYTNPDLAPNMWTNTAELNGVQGVDDDGNGVIDDIYGYNTIDGSGDPKDDHGHGSHCSGTIGAKGNDGKGIVGVNWNTRIMAIKFLAEDGSGTLENAIKGIDYATKMGAKITSNSWGGGGESEILREAIERADKAGVLFVAAAGNESNNNDTKPRYPASYQVPNILSVAAVDNVGQIAPFSNYGKNNVHVGAPGVNIVSTIVGGYEVMSGTSMATPHVSGVAGLIASHDPSLSAVEIKNRIITTARPLAGLRGRVRGAGFVDAYAALTNTVPQPDANDPENWQTMAMSVETPHPYAENSNEVFEVTVPGAKEFALHFTKFDTEKSYDVATFYDSKGNLIGVMSGNNDEMFSPVITGDYVKIVMKSDDSVSLYGFKITKAAWR